MYLPFKEFALYVNPENKLDLKNAFLYWRSLEEVLLDDEVQEYLVEAFREGELGELGEEYEVDIDYSTHVGNSSDGLPTNNFTIGVKLYEVTGHPVLEVTGVSLNSHARTNPRVTEKFFPSDRMPQRYCEICRAPTREGKPFCPEHIKEADYVKQLRAKITEMETEDEVIAQKAAESLLVSSENVKEILLALKTLGPRTVARLAKDVNKKPKVIKNYVDILAQQGIVELDETKRGAVLVKLIEN